MIENKEINRTFEKYPEYKDSGVDWLGEIPEGWGTVKLKFLIESRTGNAFPSIMFTLPDTEGIPVVRISDLDFDGIVKLDKCPKLPWKFSYEIESYGLKKGDILFAMTGGTIGKVAQFIGDDIALLNQRVCSFRINDDTTRRFILHWVNTSIWREYINLNASGGAQPNISDIDVLNLRITLPPLQEQTAIANFLDNKTSKIDTAIAQKEQMIALLKERKQIIIQNAVTGKWSMVNGEWSMTPREKMKDSGVEWIGEIPEHWEVKALKYIATLESGDTISSESFVSEGYPVYGGNGFRGYAQTYTNDGHYSLIGRQGALCGNVNYAKGKFFASEHAIVVYHKQGVNVTWLGETIKVADFNRLSQSAAQPGIAVNVIKNVLFPYPSFDEQNRIELYINTQSTKIDQAISLQQSEIGKLKEYKATLIDSAVTGKIKVTGE